MSLRKSNIYSWEDYNKSISKICAYNIKFNNKFKINSVEKSYYPHTRDLFALSLSDYKIKKVLDYGSNISALSNLNNKINTNKKKFFVFDPFCKKKLSTKIKSINYKVITEIKELQKEEINFVHFGSCLQYIENFKINLKNINFDHCLKILITATPITFGNKYKAKQTNHINLIQNVHNYKQIISFFKRYGFKVIFKSSMDINLSKLEKLNKNTYFLNILMEKK